MQAVTGQAHYISELGLWGVHFSELCPAYIYSALCGLIMGCLVRNWPLVVWGRLEDEEHAL
jgi:hypothetical protein